MRRQSITTFDAVSSLYIHIPFCRQACTYCDFHFSTNQKLRAPLVEAIVKELELRTGEAHQPLDSIYFGGGSPSILNAEELASIFEAIRQHYDMSKLHEVTLESNPDDHSAENLSLWKSLGIDRLSIGIQSFIDRDLKLMNRAHNSDQARHCVEHARNAGFNRLTIDLIYGIPGQSLEEWKINVETALSLGVNHLSAYCLTIEERTVLHHQVHKGVFVEKDDASIEAEYLHLHRTLEDAGWSHYEISNFAMSGYEAIHNSSYWIGKPYIGIGPSAHSFDGANYRRWNIANNPAYINALKHGETFWEGENLSEKDRANELLMTGLRRSAGADLGLLKPEIRTQVLENLEALDKPLKSGLQFEGNHLKIDPEKWLMTDAVVRELMVT